jgi:hypothetical protein
LAERSHPSDPGQTGYVVIVILSYIILLAALHAPLPASGCSARAAASLSAARIDTIHASLDTAALKARLRYPEPMYANRANGFVLGLYAVDRRGAGRLLALRNHGGGDDSARFGAALADAVAGMKFKPARFNGAAIAETLMVSVTFSIARTDDGPVPDYAVGVRHVPASIARDLLKPNP